MSEDDLTLFQVCDEDGKELDAHFGIDPQTKTKFMLVFESAGGGKNPRNTDYDHALTLVLVRLACARAKVLRFEVFSSEAQKLPERERIFVPDGYRDELVLHEVDDVAHLRKRIGRGAAKTARSPSAKKKSSGNPQKRLRFTLRFTPRLAPTRTQLIDRVAQPSRYDNVLTMSVAAEDSRSPSRPRGPGQGFQQDPEVRKAVEEYAMRQAEVHYSGWVTRRREHENVGYDIEFSGKKKRHLVEVKGTRTISPERVHVTLNEVRHAHGKPKQSLLFVVSGIRVDRSDDGPICSAGSVALYWNWAPTDWTPDAGTGLEVKSYYYTLPRTPHQSYDIDPEA